MKGRKRKGKKKKSKKVHIEDLSKKYNYLTSGDVNNLAAKHKIFLKSIKDFKDKFLLSSRLFKEDIDEQQDAYILCEDFPQLDNPREIRAFLSKWDYIEKEKIENYFNWILNINERSVLTQDISAPNLTREHLRNKQFGFVQDYCNHVNVLLKIFREMDITGSINDDMLQLHEQVMKSVQKTIDEFTFRIVRDGEAYMESLDSQTCNYFFDCLDFKLHIWAFKDVPLTISEDMTPKKSLDLHCLQVQLSLPFAVLQENLVVRGLHLKYDHYSKSVATYQIPYIKEETDLEYLINEEHEQKNEMRNRISNQIITEQKQREEILLEEQEKASKKKPKKAAVKRKPKKKIGKRNKKKMDDVENPEKPPIIGVEVFPDIESEFLVEQEEKHKLFLESIDPAIYQLEEGEINLREYYLNGGVYEFNFVEKPKQVIYSSAILTEIKEPASLIYKYKNCNVKTFNLGEIDIVDINVVPEEAQTRHFDPLGFNQPNQTEENDQIDNTIEPVLTFFVITFKISPDISKWTEPVACQWYSGNTNSIQHTENEEEYEEETEYLEHEILTPVVINDFMLSSNLERPLMYKIINFLIPRIPSTHRFPEEIQSVTSKTPKLVIPESLDKQTTDVATTSVPERIYPNFKPLAPLVILPLSYNKLFNDEQSNIETLKKFSDYIKELEEIQKLKQHKFAFSKKSGINDTINETEINEIEIQPLKNEKDDPSLSASTVQKTEKSIKKRQSKKKRNNINPKPKSRKSKNKLEIIKEKTCKWKFNTIAKIASILKNVYKRFYTKRKMEEEAASDNSISCKDFFNTDSIDMDCTDFPEHPKWSTKNIFKSEFNAENKELKIWTNRLGLFALAFRRYTHLPFDTWTMMPDKNKVIFYAENGFAKFFIDITESGYTIEVQDLKLSKARPVILHRIESPVKDIESFIENLRQFDLDIFPEKDAIVYIKKSCDKLLAMELHTYSCMATLSQWMQFHRSEWNRWADRRVMIVNCCVGKENLSDHDIIQITPEECLIVEIDEQCTDLSEIVLSYKPTWKNVKYAPDLQSLAHSAFYQDIYFQDTKTDNLKLQYYVMKLLRAIRPFSFSL